LPAAPGLRVVGGWAAFELTARAILEEGTDIDTANALAGRIVRTFGQPFGPIAGLTHAFPGPSVLAGADLQSIGIPLIKAEAIRALAHAVGNGLIGFEKIAESDSFVGQLSRIPGIGRGAIEWVAMRALREPDAIPLHDPLLETALGVASATDVRERSEVWRPWRAYAAAYLWKFGEEFRALNGWAGVPGAHSYRSVSPRP